MSLPLSELPGPEHLAKGLNTSLVRHTRSTSIVSRDVAGETIVVPICRGVGDLDSVYTFNSVGRSLWRLLEKAHSAEELAAWVAKQYELDEKQAFTDVRSYLAELQQAGLLQTI
jgi:Coenzyme PQQ synthesis protein D (PqqD)